LVYSSLTDPDFLRRVGAKVLGSEFEPGKLRDPYLQERMSEALDYRVRIENAIRQQDDSLLKDELNQTATQMDEWLEHIYNLASRIDRYRQERQVLERDRSRTEKRIAELEHQLALESNPNVQAQIESTLESKKQQLATLQKLSDTIRRAELQLEASHTHLGTIFTQTMLVDAKDIDSGHAQRLRHEISGEVDEIQDILLAMDEVYAANRQS
jgi:chromosome segregation ATPase